jgi:DNA-binding CsgD family transcriptional regulator
MVETKKQTDILTVREFEVLKLLTKGYTTRGIALILNISSETVTTHRKNLLKKFRVKNCAELIYVVIKFGLI